MALFTATEARSAFKARQPYLEYKDAGVALFGEEMASIKSAGQQHDVFMSYSHKDSEVVLGLCYMLRNIFQLTVYIDKDDRDLSEKDVEVAAHLKRKMSSCLSLMYVASDNDSLSHWMPWELGYFDGFRGTVAVLPITETAGTEKPQDRPYLRIYPYIDRTDMVLWVNDRKGHFQSFREWVGKGGKFNVAGA